MTTLATLHPRTRKLAGAELLEHHYGKNLHAVRYSNGDIYPLDKVHVFTGELPAQSGEALSELQTRLGTTG